MEIFITGDTHGDFRRFRPDIFYEQEHMTKEDWFWSVEILVESGTVTHGMMQDWTGWRDRSYTTAFRAREPRKL